MTVILFVLGVNVCVLLVMGVACSMCLSVGLVHVPGTVRGGVESSDGEPTPPAKDVTESHAPSQVAALRAWAHPWK